MDPRDEYWLCRNEYDALYRTHGPVARARRRGLRFRMTELVTDHPGVVKRLGELPMSPATGLVFAAANILRIGRR